jgi:hypothetical protein
MKTDKKIYQLKLKLKELKSGGHVTPDSFEGLVPSKDLKKLFLCWYDEKPLGQIVRPKAIVKYDDMIAKADSLRRDMRRSENGDIYSDIRDEWYRAIYSAIEFLLREKKEDPDLILWLDAAVPEDTERSIYIPLPVGTDGCYMPRYGYGFCPSSATLSTKISALEDAINNVCDRYESKVLESFMVDSICPMANSSEQPEILNSFT